MILMLRRWLFLVAVNLCFAFSSIGLTQGAIIIDSYSAATNDRFTNSGSFIASGFNLSGIGQSSSNRWATAISRNVVISAAHLAPSGNISFYSNNNPSTAPVIRTIQSGSGVKIAGTDLYLARLTEPLPSSIKHFSYATQFLSPSTGAGIYSNAVALMVGRSPTAQPATRSQAFGLNRISGYAENVNFLNNADADMLILNYDSPSSPFYLPYEAHLRSGDSGAPLLVNIDGKLRLLGTNGGILNSPPLSAINYVGNHASYISAYIGPQAVPEPACAILFQIALIGLCFHRRKAALA